MVTFKTGFPGSGKTYHEVDKIYNIMLKNHDLSKSIEVIYTNINGIKLNDFPKNGIELKKLNIEEFYIYLQESYKIYNSYKNSDNVDELLVKHTKEKGFYKCLIAFDECHDFLSNQDQVKVYWLTYHRHLHHEIDLLTQNKSLVHTKYRAIPEIFIEAQPISKKLFSNTLSYKHFASFAMRKNDMFNKSSLKTKKEVFELYQSGNTSKQKSIFRKFIILIFLGLFLSTLLFYLLLNSFNVFDDLEDEEIVINKNPKHQVNNVNNQLRPNFDNMDIQNEFVLKIIFDSREGYYIYNNYYSILHFRKFLRDTNSKVISKYNLISNKTYKLSQLYIKTNDDSLNKFFVVPKANTNDESNELINTKINF